MALYRCLLATQPEFAETHYRLARLLADSGAWDEAYDHFVQARDCDGLPMRSLTAFQNVYREVAARHDCVFVDGQALFHAVAPHGLLDDHLFQDGMHPSMLGQITLCEAILDGLHVALSLGLAARLTGAASRARSRRSPHFGLQARDWQTIAEGDIHVPAWQRVARWDPTQRRAKMREFEGAVKRMRAGESPEAVGLPNIGVPVGLPRSAGGENGASGGAKLKFQQPPRLMRRLRFDGLNRGAWGGVDLNRTGTFCEPYQALNFAVG